MDDQLVASIKDVGIAQPPRVKEADDRLVIIVGNHRVKAAIIAGLPEIDVLVCDADETADAMRSMSENLIRASMTSVDIPRATEALEGQGWNEQAIADALALPARTIRRLKLLANLAGSAAPPISAHSRLLQHYRRVTDGQFMAERRLAGFGERRARSGHSSFSLSRQLSTLSSPTAGANETRAMKRQTSVAESVGSKTERTFQYTDRREPTTRWVIPRVNPAPDDGCASR